MNQEYDRFEIDYNGLMLRGNIEEGNLTAHESDGEEILSILDGETENVKQISDDIYRLTQKDTQTADDAEILYYNSDSVDSYDLPAIQHLPFLVETHLKGIVTNTA